MSVVDTVLEWAAFGFGTAYVILAVRERVLCWVFGLIGVALWLVLAVKAGYYAMAFEQFIYLLLSIYGWFSWKAGEETQSLPIRHMPWRALAILIPALIITALLLRLAIEGLSILIPEMDAAHPWLDCWTTAAAFVATYMTARKYFENWPVWIAVNAVYIWMWYDRGYDAGVLMHMVYLTAAFAGMREWGRQLNASR